MTHLTSQTPISDRRVCGLWRLALGLVIRALKWGAEGTSRRSHHDALLSLQCPPPSLFLMFFLRPPLRSASKSHTKAHTPAPVALHVIFYNVLRGWVFQNFLNITKECLLICFCHQSLEKHHPCRDFIKIHFPRSAILEMRWTFFQSLS